MSASITQWEIHHEIRNHLSLIEPLLERIGSGSASQVSAGYVEMDNKTDERFTNMGWSTVEALRSVALDGAGYLWDVSGETTGHVDAQLLNEAQGFLAILACSLRGMDRKDPRVGAHPPWVATCLWNMLRTLQKRVEAEQEPERESPSQEKGNGIGGGTVSQPEEPNELTKTEREQLMPMEAFEAMADALRPLASGLGDFGVSSEVLSCFVDGDSEESELTHEGEHRITELAGIAVAAGRRLDDV